MNVSVCDSTRDTASHSRRKKGGGGEEEKLHAVSCCCTTRCTCLWLNSWRSIISLAAFHHQSVRAICSSADFSDMTPNFSFVSAQNDWKRTSFSGQVFSLYACLLKYSLVLKNLTLRTKNIWRALRTPQLARHWRRTRDLNGLVYSHTYLHTYLHTLAYCRRSWILVVSVEILSEKQNPWMNTNVFSWCVYAGVCTMFVLCVCEWVSVSVCVCVLAACYIFVLYMGRCTSTSDDQVLLGDERSKTISWHSSQGLPSGPRKAVSVLPKSFLVEKGVNER
jgi:hypothetical protein